MVSWYSGTTSREAEGGERTVHDGAGVQVVGSAQVTDTTRLSEGVDHNFTSIAHPLRPVALDGDTTELIGEPKVTDDLCSRRKHRDNPHARRVPVQGIGSGAMSGKWWGTVALGDRRSCCIRPP